MLAALEPLGSEYCGTLQRGLRGRWCDRYENRGKQSGAFSCGCYDGEPYILMNYQEDVLDHVFTLAHEAGHSMHSHYAARSQPYQYYNYAIFVAEVASTFNEELLSRHLLAQAGDDQRRAYLVNRRIDAMRATIFRQTMFAEFEKQAHASAESGEPLTVDRFRSLYRELLERYFGPDFAIDDALSLECFRIPHFYRAFYVYKYATGMSAAIALAHCAWPAAANANSTTTWASSRRAARRTRSTCSATPGSTCSSPTPSMPRSKSSSNWSTNWTGWFDGPPERSRALPGSHAPAWEPAADFLASKLPLRSGHGPAVPPAGPRGQGQCQPNLGSRTLRAGALAVHFRNDVRVPSMM